MARAMWDSSVGKKTVMARRRLIMLGYLVGHLVGNLKSCSAR
ncbi:Cytochrome b subunit OS=Streptomyces glaucescens OX=1907 GN=SGLAU_29305 PE=4 SV=1 [Streptomyces glaucescens]